MSDVIYDCIKYTFSYFIYAVFYVYFLLKAKEFLSSKNGQSDLK